MTAPPGGGGGGVPLGELARSDGRRSPKTSELVARDLANFIVDRDLPEGTRLPTEREMLDVLKVGRTTLREALRLLETRGVIVIKSGRQGGPVVRRPRSDDLSEALTLIMQFELASLADVLQARQALEPMLARLAAARADADGIAILRATIDGILDNLDDQPVFSAENQKFHAGIAQLAGSIVLRIFTDTLKSIADGVIVGVEYSPRRRKAVAQAHERIVAAIEAGDGDAAEEAMRSHLVEAGNYWQSNYSHLFGTSVRWRH